MAFDLRPMEDVLLWSGNANMAFDLRPTEDVLPWPRNVNIAFDLRLTKDVLLWPGSGYHQKDRKPSQNDKTEHEMEKTVQNQGQSPKMPKSESILKNTIECNLNPSGYEPETERIY
ncbi:hypothetical protein Tco_0303717 [Tanacetum coccineum]